MGSNEHGGKPGDEGPFDGKTYLVIRYAAGDTGTRPIVAGTPHWNSPDIVIVKPDNTRGGEAVAGALNHVEVTVHNFGGVPAVDTYVDAFICGPTTGWTPATAFSVGGGFITVPGYGNATVSLPWTPSAIDAGHRCVLARASLLIPPDTYANGTIFDVVGDRHVGQRNIHVLAMGAQKNMLFPFLVTNGLWEQGEFTVFARELRERREIEPVLRALGWGGVQLGETPLPEVEFAPLRPLKETDDGAVLAAGGAHRLWFDPRDTKPAGPLAGRLRLSMKQGDVVPAVAAIERNPRARAGDVNVVAVHQLGPRGNLVGGLTLVVVH